MCSNIITRPDRFSYQAGIEDDASAMNLKIVIIENSKTL